MRHVLIVILLFLTSASCESVAASETANAASDATVMLAQDDTTPSLRHRTLPVERTTDPYADWKTWCEPAQLPACKTVADCKDVVHPSGRALKCLRPWYAERGSDLGVCSPGFSNRFERDHQRARIRELVRLQYSGEAELCADGDTSWRCTQREVRGNRLAALLNMVAQRETTMTHWKRHRLNGDVSMARWAWERTAKDYGHERIVRDQKVRRRGKTSTGPVVVGVRFHDGGNRHFRQKSRWEFGLGLYGMNAALFTRNWSKAAPPEVLCREVEATETYLRSARRGWKKLAGGIDCDGQPGREWHGVGGKPTWYDVHHYTSGGKLCPSKKSMANFEKAAKKAGFPAFAPVSLAELGTPIGSDGQNETARLLGSQLDVYSTIWLAQSADR